MNLVVFKMQQANDARLERCVVLEQLCREREGQVQSAPDLGRQEDADQRTAATETFACSQSLKGCSPCPAL